LSLTSTDADSRPCSLSRRRLVVQSLTVSTAAVSPRCLLHLTDAIFHVVAYAAAFLFTVLVAAVPLLVSVGLIYSKYIWDLRSV